MALTMKDVQADRAALKDNYLFKNRYAIIKWAKENDQEFLPFTTKAEAYAFSKGEAQAYKNGVAQFNAVRKKYEAIDHSGKEKVTMKDVLA